MFIGNDEVFQAATRVRTKLFYSRMYAEYFFNSLLIFYYLETAFHTFDDVKVTRVGDRLQGGK